MDKTTYTIQYFSAPPILSGGCCKSASQNNPSVRCGSGVCSCGVLPRKIEDVTQQLQENHPQKYEFYIASYQSKNEVEKAIEVFNRIMITSGEEVRAENVNGLFTYLATYAPLTAINYRLIYVQYTPAASHIEQAIQSYF